MAPPMDTKKPAVTAPALDPKYKGTKTYRLEKPHYRRGQYFEAGSTITVTDEKPSKHWVEVVPRARVEMVDATPAKPSVPEV